MSIEEKRDQLVEELVPFEDHLDRFAYVIDRAKDAPGLKDDYKIEKEENLTSVKIIKLDNCRKLCWDIADLNVTDSFPLAYSLLKTEIKTSQYLLV